MSTVGLPLAPSVQAFFVDYLRRQKGASPRTIAAYRDTSECS